MEELDRNAAVCAHSNWPQGGLGRSHRVDMGLEDEVQTGSSLKTPSIGGFKGMRYPGPGV